MNQRASVAQEASHGHRLRERLDAIESQDGDGVAQNVHSRAKPEQRRIREKENLGRESRITLDQRREPLQIDVGIGCERQYLGCNPIEGRQIAKLDRYGDAIGLKVGLGGAGCLEGDALGWRAGCT
jgi:hypothetical protein